eukprot:TRINITY_DN14962_c0_g1_i1.p1 TRINITY_DN14962_c0_g1~~TRINITY_DN14962_c0_g1_i1.p1  ORF type:complete len:672 (+),score=116.69 TRINITY_DN14962_c0_g1_i1:176-2191(+)
MLPDDAPPLHDAWTQVRFHDASNSVRFHINASTFSDASAGAGESGADRAPRVICFQATLSPPLEDREEAERLCRLCYVRFSTELGCASVASTAATAKAAKIKLEQELSPTSVDVDAVLRYFVDLRNGLSVAAAVADSVDERGLLEASRDVSGGGGGVGNAESAVSDGTKGGNIGSGEGCTPTPAFPLLASPATKLQRTNSTLDMSHQREMRPINVKMVQPGCVSQNIGDRSCATGPLAAASAHELPGTTVDLYRTRCRKKSRKINAIDFCAPAPVSAASAASKAMLAETRSDVKSIGNLRPCTREHSAENTLRGVLVDKNASWGMKTENKESHNFLEYLRGMRYSREVESSDEFEESSPSREHVSMEEEEAVVTAKTEEQLHVGKRRKRKVLPSQNRCFARVELKLAQKHEDEEWIKAQAGMFAGETSVVGGKHRKSKACDPLKDWVVGTGDADECMQELMQRSVRCHADSSGVGTSPISQLLCMSRIWAGGWGGQCTSCRIDGTEYCQLHLQQLKRQRYLSHGRIDGPVPPKKLLEFEKWQATNTRRNADFHPLNERDFPIGELAGSGSTSGVRVACVGDNGSAPEPGMLPGHRAIFPEEAWRSFGRGSSESSRAYWFRTGRRIPRVAASNGNVSDGTTSTGKTLMGGKAAAKRGSGGQDFVATKLLARK